MTIARFEKAYGYKGVGRSGQGGQAALSLAGKQAGVLRSIVKQSVGPCKTEASQKPVHLDPRLVRTLRAWRRSARFRQPTDWVFRQSCPPGEVPFLGTGPLATLHPAGCGKGGHHQTKSAGIPFDIRIRRCFRTHRRAADSENFELRVHAALTCQVVETRDQLPLRQIARSPNNYQDARISRWQWFLRQLLDGVGLDNRRHKVSLY